jgi:hypothetical protein
MMLINLDRWSKIEYTAIFEYWMEVSPLLDYFPQSIRDGIFVVFWKRFDSSYAMALML